MACKAQSAVFVRCCPRAFAFGGINRQAELLAAEGVEVRDNRVDLDRFLWDGLD